MDRKFIPQNPVMIHLGATKVFTVVASRSVDAENDEVEILAIGVAAMDGFACGKITHQENFVRAIKASVADAEKMANLRIDSATIVLASPQMQSVNACGSVFIEDRAIEPQDMTGILSDAKAQNISPDYYVIQFFLQRIWANETVQAAYNIIGMTGVFKLQASYHLMALPNQTLNHLQRTFDSCSITIDGFMLDIVADAHYVLSKEEKERGVLLVDMGADSTSFCIYKENILCLSACIEMGGNHIIEQITHQLSISVDDAKRFKRHHVSLTEIDKNKSIFIDTSSMSDVRTVNVNMLSKTVKAGLDAICEAIMARLTCEGWNLSYLEAGIVLLGEGSQIKDIEPYLKSQYKTTVSLGHDRKNHPIYISRQPSNSNIKSIQQYLSDPQMSTALGAMLHYVHDETIHQQRVHLQYEYHSKNDIASKLLRWYQGALQGVKKWG